MHKKLIIIVIAIFSAGITCSQNIVSTLYLSIPEQTNKYHTVELTLSPVKNFRIIDSVRIFHHFNDSLFLFTHYKDFDTALYISDSLNVDHAHRISFPEKIDDARYHNSKLFVLSSHRTKLSILDPNSGQIINSVDTSKFSEGIMDIGFTNDTAIILGSKTIFLFDLVVFDTIGSIQHETPFSFLYYNIFLIKTKKGFVSTVSYATGMPRSSIFLLDLADKSSKLLHHQEGRDSYFRPSYYDNKLFMYEFNSFYDFDMDSFFHEVFLLNSHVLAYSGISGTYYLLQDNYLKVFKNNVEDSFKVSEILYHTNVYSFLHEKASSNITEENPLKFRIYPNPASAYLNIETEQNIDLIQILNSNGKLIDQMTINTNTYKMDVSDLPPGPYLINIISGNTSSGNLILIK